MSEKQTTSDKPVSQADANAALDGMPPANGGTGQATAQPQQQEQGPDLTVSDLNALKSIIDVASQRGAFKPNEMMTVGQVYTKLEAFLNAVTSQQGNG
jgi:hypothetical protein